MATMFGSNQKKTPSTETPAPMVSATLRKEPEPMPESSVANVIGRGTVIEGNIIAEGDLILEGTVRGDVTTKTKLVVGSGSIVEGNILADHAEVAGRVRGTVQASGLLTIKATSVIDGDVITKNLNVESGSTFNGRFQVGGKVEASAKPVIDQNKKDQQPVVAKV